MKNTHELSGIGKLIREKRTKKKLSARQLGDRIGRTRAVVTKYELGLIKVPASVMPVLSKELGIPLSAFFDER